MKIRNAVSKDLRKIAELLHEYDLYEHSLDKRIKVDSLKETKKDIAKRFMGKKIIFTLIKTDNKIIGIIPWEIRTERGKKAGVLHDLAITKDYRGKGAGTALFNRIIKEMKKKGCKSVRSFVRPKNIKSQKFWKNKGFSMEPAKHSKGFTIRKRI